MLESFNDHVGYVGLFLSWYV